MEQLRVAFENVLQINVCTIKFFQNGPSKAIMAQLFQYNIMIKAPVTLDRTIVGDFNWQRQVVRVSYDLRMQS